MKALLTADPVFLPAQATQTNVFLSFSPLYLSEIEFVFGNVTPQGTIMEEMDFERRRELRRQKREEMRLEAER